MHLVFDVAMLYLFFKIVVPIAIVALIAYAIYRAVAGPTHHHTFVSSEPEDYPDDETHRL